VTIASTPREKALNSVFATALEGGINYWATVRAYTWSDRTPEHNPINEFEALIFESEDEGAEVLTIDAAVIRKGITLFYKFMRGLDNPNPYQLRAAKDLYYGKYDEVDYDADTADMIVQFGLFEELVYG
jgi:hypothetical protein